jgi:hypothetical protein
MLLFYAVTRQILYYFFAFTLRFKLLPIPYLQEKAIAQLA